MCWTALLTGRAATVATDPADEKKGQSQKVPPEELLVAYLASHVRDVFPSHDLKLTCFNEVSLPLQHREVEFPLLFLVLGLKTVFVELAESVVHLRSRPLVVSMVELYQS